MPAFTATITDRATANIEELIASHARAIAVAMGEHISGARTEEDIRQEFSALIRTFLYEAKLALTIRAHHEYGLAGGRIDAKYGGVIIEYKNPSSPDRIEPDINAPSTRRLVRQIQSRFASFEKEENVEQKRLFGCGIDGRRILFVRNRTGRFEIENPQPLTPECVDRLLRALVSLGASGNSFTPTNLCADFGAISSVARNAVAALYEAIRHTDDPKALTLFDQWRLLFSEVCGYRVTESNAAINDLAYQFGIETPNSALFLFALHTYYSIFIKLLSSEIVSVFSTFRTSII